MTANVQADANAIRKTQYGDLMGGAGSYDSYVWYGVPYAMAPVGELRWRAPRPAAAWMGVRQATEMSKPCCQIYGGTGVGYGEATDAVLGQEDCLYLTIWTSRLTPTDIQNLHARLPVMVWIHGGGSQVGHGAEYTGAALAVSQKVVVVSINYRLNILGWFSHRALRALAGTPEDRSGNYGTLDQIQALRWVRENIAAFGGDSGNVTIFGQSGGGQCVRALLQSPQAEKLFHHAIVISAAGYQVMSVEHSENCTTDAIAGHPLSSNEVLISLLQLDGMAGDSRRACNVLAAMSDEAVATYLRSKTYPELLRGIVATRNRNIAVASAEARTKWASDVTPLFMSDGAVIKGEWHGSVPTMVGCNLYDDAIFLESQFTNVDGVLRLKDKPYFKILAEYFGKFYKIQSTDQFADDVARRGSPVYVYRFDWADLLCETSDEDCIDIHGATHGLDARFIFGTLELGREMEGRKHMFDDRPGSSFHVLSDAMMSYFAQFAACGNPGRGRHGLLTLWDSWPPGRFIIFDSERGGGVRMQAGHLTKGEVIDEINSDARLASKESKHRFCSDLRGHLLTVLTEDDYLKILAG